MSFKTTKSVDVVVLNCRFKRIETVMKILKRSCVYTAAFYVESKVFSSGRGSNGHRFNRVESGFNLGIESVYI